MRIVRGYFYILVVFFLQNCTDGISDLPQRINSSASDVVAEFARTCMGGSARARAVAVLSTSENSCIFSSDSNCEEKQGKRYKWVVKIQGRKDILAEFAKESDKVTNKDVITCRFYFYDVGQDFKKEVISESINKFKVKYKYNVIWGYRENFDGINDGYVHIFNYVDRENFEYYVRNNGSNHVSQNIEIDQYWKYYPGFIFSINYVMN